MAADTEKLRQETVSQINELKKSEKLKKLELEQLKAGNKAYPSYLEEARSYLQRRLLEETGKGVDVYILADLLEVKNDQWRNAIEGYLGGNKLNLVVAPKYAKTCLERIPGRGSKCTGGLFKALYEPASWQGDQM